MARGDFWKAEGEEGKLVARFAVATSAGVGGAGVHLGWDRVCSRGRVVFANNANRDDQPGDAHDEAGAGADVYREQGGGLMNFLRRVARSFFTRKMAGRLLFVAACLATLLVLLLVEENWRGKRDWQAFVREHEASGDRLDMGPFVPPPVPDGQNFANTPLLKPLFEERGEN